MTWSYSITDLASSQKDQVRLLIGDTNSAQPLLQDEEISFQLSQRSTIWGAAAECCRSIQAAYSSQVDQTAGGSSMKFSQRAKAYALKAAEFEQKAAMTGSGAPYAGGISIADKQSQDANSDRVQPQFVVGADDNYLPLSPSNPSPIEQSGGGT